MSNPNPTRHPGGPQGPGDAEPQPSHPDVVVEDEMAAVWRRARRRDLLARLGIALGGLLVVTALLLALAAIQISQQPSGIPTTVPAPVTVPAPGPAGPTYTPVPAGKP